MEHGILHEPSEEFAWLKTGRLMSLLDLMGTYKVTCTRCGRWQTAATLDDLNAAKIFSQSGWKMPEEICPKCASGKNTPV